MFSIATEPIGWIYRGEKGFYLRNWFMKLWRSESPKISRTSSTMETQDDLMLHLTLEGLQKRFFFSPRRSIFFFLLGLQLIGWGSPKLWRVMCFIWRRQWHPTPVLLPGNSLGWRSLVGCHLGAAQSRTQLKRLSSSSSNVLYSESTDLNVNSETDSLT